MRLRQVKKLKQNNKKLKLFLFGFVFLTACGDSTSLVSSDLDAEQPVIGGQDIVSNTQQEDLERQISVDVQEDVESPSDIPEERDAVLDNMEMDNLPSYPDGPYSLDVFNVLPNMSFFDPWQEAWFSLEDLYLHEEKKAFLLVSSAGWCGPCFMEAAALIDIYDKYMDEGLEIIYTLGNTNFPGDVPFDIKSDKMKDIAFMNAWKNTVKEEAQQDVNYKVYADPKREFIKHVPNHAWPFSILITTKDMGIRLVEEGYWSALIENKIMLVLYNEVPNIPFD